MWTTPAPPSTALVAASIWPGTGEVNTSPGAAASSMPSPTKPPWRGSCPDPPPEIKATLPFLGASLRTTRWFAASYRSRSPCAAASPFRDSFTTAAGSLRNFRIWLVSTAILFYFSRRYLVGGCALRGVVVGHGLDDRPRDQPGVGQEVIEECRRGCAHQARNQVDGEVLRPESGATGDRLHQLRAESTRWIEGCTGDRAEDEDDSDHRAADDKTGELRRRLRVDDAENREDEESGTKRLCQRGLQVVAGGCVSRKMRLAHPKRGGVRSEHTPDGERSDDGPHVLGHPVDRDFLPREALRDRKREGHRWIDVAPRDLADRIDKGGDDEPEGEADRQ